jgi:hypothetical protein
MVPGLKLCELPGELPAGLDIRSRGHARPDQSHMRSAVKMKGGGQDEKRVDRRAAEDMAAVLHAARPSASRSCLAAITFRQSTRS